MKNLTVEFNVLKTKETYQKRDYLLSLLVNTIDSLSERCWFIEIFSTPLKMSEPNKEMDKIISGIFGYYIYLYENEPNNDHEFLNAAIHDLHGLLDGELKNGFSPRTKSYTCYLKE